MIDVVRLSLGSLISSFGVLRESSEIALRRLIVQGSHRILLLRLSLCTLTNSSTTFAVLKVSIREDKGTACLTVRLYGPNTDIVINRERELKVFFRPGYLYWNCPLENLSLLPLGWDPLWEFNHSFLVATFVFAAVWPVFKHVLKLRNAI